MKPVLKEELLTLYYILSAVKDGCVTIHSIFSCVKRKGIDKSYNTIYARIFELRDLGLLKIDTYTIKQMRLRRISVTDKGEDFLRTLKIIFNKK